MSVRFSDRATAKNRTRARARVRARGTAIFSIRLGLGSLLCLWSG